MMKFADIKANPRNPRRIRGERFDKLQEYLQRFGDLSGVVVNSDGTIISGHQRMQVFRREKGKLTVLEQYSPPQDDGTTARGFIELKNGQRYVYREVNWDAEKADEATIVANGQFGEWDSDILTNEWEFDVPELRDMGVPEFVFGEESNALNSEKREAEEDGYEIPDEIKTDIVPGDLFEIGQHRLLCGDSTHADTVAKVLNGEKPFLMVTDPPYGVEYDADWRNHALRADGTAIAGRAVGKVSNDDKADWAETWSLSPCSVAYVWHADRHAKTVQESIERCDFEVRNQVIWAKSNFAISRGHYHWKHEPCWYAVKNGATAKWRGDHSQTTLWEIDKPIKSETGHSTQKPVECMARPIRNHEGDVYDPFLGSGTTMVAAHQLGRRCFGIEIDPKYCQVIIDRMAKLDPNLEIKRNGQPYNKLKN